MKQNEITHSVIIDGVPYAPMMTVIPEMESIAKGLLSAFWDEDSLREKTLKELMEGICIRVFDDGYGKPIEQVLSTIAKELSKTSEQQ